MATLPEAIGAFISDAVTVASKAAGSPMPGALGEKRRTKTEFGYSTLLPLSRVLGSQQTPCRLDLQDHRELGYDPQPRIARGLLAVHSVSPAARRKPDRNSSRCSAFRYGMTLGITEGAISRSRLTISCASLSRPMCP